MRSVVLAVLPGIPVKARRTMVNAYTKYTVLRYGIVYAVHDKRINRSIRLCSTREEAQELVNTLEEIHHGTEED